MPTKNKKVHNTKSVLGRSRSNSSLRVKVHIKLAKAKDKPKQTLKSIVKVVNNKPGKATQQKRVSFSDKGSAPPANAQPQQTTFTDAMEKWKRSMVDAINAMPCVMPGSSAAPVHALLPNQNYKIYKQADGQIQMRDGSPQLVQDNTAPMVVDSDNSIRTGGRSGLQDSMDDSQLVPSIGVEEDMFLDADSMEMDEEDYLPPPP